MQQKRIPYLDLLRIISCFLIVLVHVSAQHIADLPVDGSAFYITLSLDCLGLIGVPLFVMISGALTLRPEYHVQLKNILLHKTLHFFLLYYIWKAFYQVYALLASGQALTLSNIKNDVILALIQKSGYYHLWFLPMLALLYMFLPMIKKDVESSKTVCLYFLCVFFITALLFPTLFHYEFKFKYLFVDFLNQNDFYLFSGYLGYFILGHYLHAFTESRDRKWRLIIYLLGILSFVLACVLGIRASLADQAPSYIMNTPFAATSFFMAAAVFAACQAVLYTRTLSERFCRLLKTCADTTLGIYLIHPLAIEFLKEIGLDTDICTPLLSVPLITACIVLICGIAAHLLLKIPVLKRLLR